MGDLWVPGAERLTPSSGGGTSDYPEAGARAVAHTTECPSGGQPGSPDYWFRAMDRVLRSKAAEPNLLYDPLTDKLGQYFPLNATGRAMLNDGGRRTNRVGRVCVQIEFVGWASRPFTRNWQPGPRFRAMMDSIGSWGVPDGWPSGDPPPYPGGRDERSREIWYSRAGWYGHSQVPGNFHGDPGGISADALFAAQRDGVEFWPTWPAKFPGRDALGAGKGDQASLNLLLKAALIAHGGYGAMGATITADWDKKSDDRIAGFKEKRKIDEPGVGPETFKALGRMPREAPDFPGAAKFKLGEKSVQSQVGQALLVLQGFRKPLNHTITKEWRPGAVKALRRFQLSEPRLAGDADGKWGPLTWKLAWTDSD